MHLSRFALIVIILLPPLAYLGYSFVSPTLDQQLHQDLRDGVEAVLLRPSYDDGRRSIADKIVLDTQADAANGKKAGLLVHDIQITNYDVADAVQVVRGLVSEIDPRIRLVVGDADTEYFEQLGQAIKHADFWGKDNNISEYTDLVERSFFMTGSIKVNDYGVLSSLTGQLDIKQVDGFIFPVNVSVSRVNSDVALGLIAYIAGMIVLFSVLTSRHTNAVLARIEAARQDNRIADARAIVVSQKGNALARLKGVDSLLHDLDNASSEADTLITSTKLALAEFDYDGAEALIDQALAVNSSHKDAKALKARMPTKRAALNTYSRGEAMISQSQTEAIALFEDAAAQDPDLMSRVRAQVLALRTQQSANVDHGGAIVATTATSSGDVYKTLASIDKALVKASADPNAGGTKSRLRDQRETCLAAIPRLSDACVVGPSGQIYISTKDSAYIGRPSSDFAPDLPIQHKRVSRAQKQLRVLRDNGAMFVEDLGSSNGTFLGNAPLTIGQRTSVTPDGLTLALGGSISPPQAGECRLKVTALGPSKQSALIEIDPLLRALKNDSAATFWTNRDEVISRRLVMLHGSIGLTADENNPIAHANDWGIQSTDSGLMLTIKKGALNVNGADIHYDLPLAMGQVIKVQGATYRVLGS